VGVMSVGVAFVLSLSIVNGGVAKVDKAAQCLDNKGFPTSWWFMLKLPNGFDYAYVDASTVRSSYFKPYDYAMDDRKHPSALTRTLMALANHPTVEQTSELNETRSGVDAPLELERGGTTPYLLYNDQPPDGLASNTYGHSKGVIAATQAGGLWITHSTPHFPSASGSAQFWFPESETVYGQTFLCMSLGSGDIDKVGENLLYNRPFIYKNTFSSSDLEPYPHLMAATHHQWIKDAGTNTAAIAGGKFTAFAKNSAWGGDLYEGLVAPHFKTDLLVESWIRGSAEGSFCKPRHKHDVVDVETLTMVGRDGGANVSWSEGQDHGKWAVSLGADTLLCVGDINRMTTQRKRGGGAVCFEDSSLSDSLYNCVVTSHVCRK